MAVVALSINVFAVASVLMVRCSIQGFFESSNSSNRAGERRGGETRGRDAATADQNRALSPTSGPCWRMLNSYLV